MFNSRAQTKSLQEIIRTISTQPIGDFNTAIPKITERMEQANKSVWAVCPSIVPGMLTTSKAALQYKQSLEIAAHEQEVDLQVVVANEKLLKDLAYKQFAAYRQ